MGLRDPAPLGPGPVEIAVAGELAVGDGHDRLLGVPGPLFRDGRVKHHQDPLPVALIHKVPEHRHRRRRTKAGRPHPPEGDAIKQQHGDKDQRIHQRHAQIPGDDKHRPGRDGHVQRQLQYTEKMILSVLQQGHMAGHGVDKDDLAHLAGLDVDTAQRDPAFVAAHILAQPLQRKLKGHIKERRRDPEPWEPLKIAEGQDDHAHKACGDADTLDQDQPLRVHLLDALAAAEDQHQSAGADQKRQHHQQRIRLLQIAADALPRFLQHALPPFALLSFCYSTIPPVFMQERTAKTKKRFRIPFSNGKMRAILWQNKMGR